MKKSELREMIREELKSISKQGEWVVYGKDGRKIKWAKVFKDYKTAEKFKNKHKNNPYIGMWNIQGFKSMHPAYKIN